MDFFEAQYRAKRRTGLLVFLFAASVLAIIAGVYLVAVVALGTQTGQVHGFDPVLFGVVAVGTGAVIGMGSLFRSLQLRKGGSAVASLLGGRRISSDTSDPDEQRLVNVVEEMSIASGTPVPAIFVLDNEDSINAFAAGHSIHDAAVAVTRGTLERLDRDELQGVIAHEFSHILNGDMRLNVRLAGLLFGILLLAVVGRGFLRGSLYRGGRRRGGGGQAALIGLALVLLGYVGVLFGKLIKAAVSRQREYLADAAAVQFTRNPGGIGGALRKIQGHASGGRIDDHHAEELSHLFFADGVGGAFSRAMATHPPLEERIRRVDPSGIWAEEGAAGREERVRKAEKAETGRERREEAAEASAPGAGKGPADLAGSPERLAAALAGAAVLLGSVGSPRPDHLRYARELLERIPPEVRKAVHDPRGAQAVVLGLIGDGGEEAGSQATVRESVESLDLMDHMNVFSRVGELEAAVRLPLLDMALPALQSLSPERADAFRSAVQRAIRSDGAVRPFDFALVHILWRHLPRASAGTRDREGTVRSLKPLRGALASVLSAIAWAGADDGEEAALAFDAARGALPNGEAEAISLRPREAVGFVELDEALGRLERGSLEVRRGVLEACAAAVLADREVRTSELELLRAVAECLELPLPPILPD